MREKIADIICSGSTLAESLADEILSAVIAEIKDIKNPYISLRACQGFGGCQQAIIKKLEAKE